MKSEKILVGVKAFQEFIGVGENVIYKLFSMGMPAGRVDGRIYGHTDNVEDWFRAVMRQRVKDIEEGEE